jgi:hypothetical protein
LLAAAAFGFAAALDLVFALALALFADGALVVRLEDLLDRVAVVRLLATLAVALFFCELFCGLLPAALLEVLVVAFRPLLLRVVVVRRLEEVLRREVAARPRVVLEEEEAFFFAAMRFSGSTGMRASG